MADSSHQESSKSEILISYLNSVPFALESRWHVSCRPGAGLFAFEVSFGVPVIVNWTSVVFVVASTSDDASLSRGRNGSTYIKVQARTEWGLSGRHRIA